MPSKSKKERFANKAEEAAWWEANAEALANVFEKTVNEGYAGPCTVVVTGDSTVTRIRLSSNDVGKTHVQATKRGQCFQNYLKAIIHETLCKAD